MRHSLPAYVEQMHFHCKQIQLLRGTCPLNKVGSYSFFGIPGSFFENSLRSELCQASKAAVLEEARPHRRVVKAGG